MIKGSIIGPFWRVKGSYSSIHDLSCSLGSLSHDGQDHSWWRKFSHMVQGKLQIWRVLHSHLCVACESAALIY